MRYFIDGISDEQWMINLRAYWKKFDKIKNKLPNRLTEIFSSKYLHDSEITSIIFKRDETKEGNIYNLSIEVKNDEFKGRFVHYNAKIVRSLHTDDSKYNSLYEYLYGEILYEKKKWIHNISYYPDGTLGIICDKVDWQE